MCLFTLVAPHVLETLDDVPAPGELDDVAPPRDALLDHPAGGDVAPLVEADERDVQLGEPLVAVHRVLEGHLPDEHDVLVIVGDAVGLGEPLVQFGQEAIPRGAGGPVQPDALSLVGEEPDVVHDETSLYMAKGQPRGLASPRCDVVYCLRSSMTFQPNDSQRPWVGSCRLMRVTLCFSCCAPGRPLMTISPTL